MPKNCTDYCYEPSFRLLLRFKVMNSNPFHNTPCFSLCRVRPEVSHFLTHISSFVVRMSLTITFLLWTGTQVKAQDYLPYGEDFIVTYSTEVPVSGGVLAGIFQGNPNQRVNPESLRVYLPSAEWPRLCLKTDGTPVPWPLSTTVSLSIVRLSTVLTT